MDEPDIKKICRACNKSCDQMRCIFETKEFVGVTFKLADIIMACASVSISNEDELPKSICESCLDRLCAAYSFKTQVENVDCCLRDTFHLRKIKQEITIENDLDLVVTTCDGGMDDTPIKEELESDTNNEFLCVTCNEKFASYVALTSHQRSHQAKKKYTKTKFNNKKTGPTKPIKNYRCKICFDTYSSMHRVKRHMLTHLKTKPYVCRICQRGFTNLENLNFHENHCEGQRPHICTICSKGFKREDSLQVHMSSHEIQPMIDSVEDIESFIEVAEEDNTTKEISPHEFLDPNIGINELEHETEIHSDVSDGSDWESSYVKSTKKSIKRKLNAPPFTCDVCTKTFPRAYHLSRHKRSHSDEKPFQCEICEKTFTRKDHVLRHLRLHTVEERVTYPCDLCSCVFVRKDVLARHKATKHYVGERPIIEKKFKCDICSKLFTTDKYRAMHMKVHSEKDENGYCKTCNKDFETRKELLRHLSLANDCSKKLLCSECGQRFIKESQLQVHIRRHRGEKPFKCRFCDKGFPRTTDLKAHEKCHTGEKNHLCIVCGKGFGRAYKLTLHMRTHTGEKPYACTMCDATFTQSNDLKTHIRRHTGERYHCDICPEAFLVGYMLTHHKRKVHGIEVPLTQRPLARFPSSAVVIPEIELANQS